MIDEEPHQKKTTEIQTSQYPFDVISDLVRVSILWHKTSQLIAGREYEVTAMN